MKNKKLTYFLVIVTLSIWGIVFYRIISSVGGNDVVTNYNLKQERSAELIDSTETFLLIADYRDPFLGSKIRKPALTRIKKAAVVVVEKEKMDGSLVSYLGLISNSNNKKTVGVIRFKGKEYLVSDGDAVEDLVVVKNYKDSVKVKFKGSISYIKRGQ
jgi:hypothetical protein